MSEGPTSAPTQPKDVFHSIPVPAHSMLVCSFRLLELIREFYSKIMGRNMNSVINKKLV